MASFSRCKKKYRKQFSDAELSVIEAMATQHVENGEPQEKAYVYAVEDILDIFDEDLKQAQGAIGEQQEPGQVTKEETYPATVSPEGDASAVRTEAVKSDVPSVQTVTAPSQARPAFDEESAQVKEEPGSLTKANDKESIAKDRKAYHDFKLGKNVDEQIKPQAEEKETGSGLFFRLHGQGPRKFEMVRNLDRNEADLPEERYYEVKDVQTGRIEVVEENDLKPIGDKSKAWMAEPKFSRSSTQGQTVSEVEQAISSNAKIKKMMDAGKLKVVATADEFPVGSVRINIIDPETGTKHLGAGTYLDDKDIIYLAADAIPAGQELNFVQHEAFHRASVNGETKPILAELGRIEKMAGKKGAVADWFMKARESAQVDKDAPHYIEEIGAYAVSNYQESPNIIKRWVDKLIAKVKLVLFRTFGTVPSKLDPAFLREVAITGLNAGKAYHVSHVGEMVPKFSRVAPIIEEMFDVPEKHTVATAIKGAFDPLKFKKANVKKTISKARTQLIDRLHPIEALGDVPYKLHSLLNNTHAILGAFLQHGKLSWKDQALIIEGQKNEGFLPWLHSLGEDGRNLFYWIAAKRAEKLEVEGRENWLTADKRKEILDTQVFKGLSPQERSAKEKEFEKLNDKFQEYNQNVIDVAIEAGLLSKNQTDAWMRDFYLPFYRILEDEATHDEFLQGPFKQKKYISAQIKRLKGGEEKIGDPLENILRNWTHLIQESQRNVARKAADEVAISMGLAEVVPGNELFKSPGARRENSIVSHQENGKAVFVKHNDIDLFEALSNVNAKAFDSKFLRLLTGAKRLLTDAATFTISFRIANMVKDTVHTAVVSKSFKPIYDTARGFIKVWKESPEYIALSASGGGFSNGYIESGDPKAMARGIEKILAREGKGARGLILDTLRRILEFWKKVGTVSEMAARVQLYSNLRMEGESHMEAAFRARDLLDFYKSGASNSVRVIMATTPFLNARIQGLDRLYRGAKEDKLAFFTKGAIVAGASLLLWSLFKDDERYKELEDWEKWQYHHFWIGDNHYRIPKAFEVGAIFSSLFESAANVANETEDMEFFGRFLLHTLTQTFSMSFPAAFGPSIEAYANKSFFTGRPIESMGMKKLPPGERSEPWTPELLKDLGEGLNISPKMMQHLILGHTSAFGAMFLTVADAFYREATDAAPRPAMRIEDVPGVGRFVRSEDSKTKYTTRYYEFAKDVDELAATISNYKNIGDFKMARQVARENRDILRHKKYVNKTKLILSGIRKEEKRVWASDLDPEIKKEKLRLLFKQKNKVLQESYKRTHR